jgi:hypothetical protein
MPANLLSPVRTVQAIRLKLTFIFSHLRVSAVQLSMRCNTPCWLVLLSWLSFSVSAYGYNRPPGSPPAAPTTVSGFTDARLLWASLVPGHPTGDLYELVEYPAQVGIAYAGQVYFSVPAQAASGAVHVRVKATTSEAAGASAASTVPYPTPPAGLTDVFLVGDSNTAAAPGSFTQPGRSFASLATTLLAGRYNIINIGTGGISMSSETDLFQTLLSTYTPVAGKRVLAQVMLGTNSPALGISLEQAKVDLGRYKNLLASVGAAGFVCSAIEPLFTGPHNQFFVDWAAYLSTNYAALGFTEYVPVWENPKLGYTVADFRAAQLGLPSNQRFFNRWDCNGNYAGGATTPGSACAVYQVGGPADAGGTDFFHWGNEGHAEAFFILFLPAIERANVTLANAGTVPLPLRDAQAVEDYLLYPNPTTHLVHVSKDSPQVIIRDVLGRAVPVLRHPAGQLELPGPGVYFVEWPASPGNAARRKKLVVQ